ncbi:enterotoxin A family protein [Paraburkholderia fungorum]|uniref:enterotoxin A family protein n=1 Tax=Paraburkholderia fungorum TaxID=134537 RepID=UPI0038BC4111
MMTTSGIGSTKSTVFPDDLDGSTYPLPLTVRRDASSAGGKTPPEKEPVSSPLSPLAAGDTRAARAVSQTGGGEAAPKSTFSTAERFAALRSANLQARSGERPAKEAAAVPDPGKTNDADLSAQSSRSSDTLQRVRRTPPPPADRQPDDHPTFDALAGPSTGNNGLGFAAMQGAADDPTALPNHCAGMVTASFYNIATGRASNLAEVNSFTHDRLADPRTRQRTLDGLDRMQERNQDNIEDDMPGFVARSGEFAVRGGDDLHSTLAYEFGERHSSDDGRGSYQTVMMPVVINYRDPPSAGTVDGVRLDESHMIVVQRLNPSENYENDRYQIYDPNYGTFDYQNFRQMSTAMDSLLGNGYPQHGGISHLDVFPYAAASTWQPYDEAAPQRSSLGDASFHSLDDANGDHGLQGAHALSLPSVSLPPPNFEQRGRPPHDENKRDLGPVPDPQPYTLYRPSNVTPEQMKQANGFNLQDTRMQNVNLDLHNFQLAARPGAVDGAGYLGTFRDRLSATERLSSGAQKSGYVYYVAPSPNMVDVDASLGRGDRMSDAGEVAAMGRIDSSQVRGWRKFENGELGSYVVNPDYRSDIFDHTRTAGAQPQLAHFSTNNSIWTDDDHKSFVSETNSGGKARYVPKADPAMASAEFYQRARDKIQYLDNQQAKGEDYRGSVYIKPFFNNDDGKGKTKLNFYNDNSYPSVDSAYSSNSEYKFSIGDDGRIHSAGDYSKVLRIDGKGNAYIGGIPSDPANMNGVFVYDPHSGGLQHVQDHRWLTEGISAFTPYVAPPQAPHGELAARQSWRLENGKGDTVQPPTPGSLFPGNSVGTPQQLYQFYQDQDTALPKGSTRFVTDLPGSTYSGSGDTFAESRTHIQPDDVSRINTWLAAHNAAWLFRDGLYAVPAAPNQLEIRGIGGTPFWRVSVDPATHRVHYESLHGGQPAPGLKISESLWNRAVEQQKRYANLEERGKQFYM